MQSPLHDEKDTLADEVRDATALLEGIAADHSLLDRLSPEDRQRFHAAVGHFYHPDPVHRRRKRKAQARERNAAQVAKEEAVLHTTGIRELRRRPVFTTPNVFAPESVPLDDIGDNEPERRESIEPQHCYVCKQKYSLIHHFYDQLCPACADFNFAKRTETADLRGRVALLTGGRVKIGYQAGLKLLRAGASLIVTTRFPRDSAARYVEEPDFGEWSDRLEIFGLDLRHTPSVETFTDHVKKHHTRVDYVVNNACQTVRRPAGFYRHLMDEELRGLSAVSDKARPLLRG